MKILVVGATGSVGRLVVEEALACGHSVRALLRTAAKASLLAPLAKVVIGDVTRPETLSDAVAGIDAVVFTLGSDGQGKIGAEAIDYGGVRNVLIALRGRSVRIALMTAIGVTNRSGAYNRSTEAHDWKRRSERLVRVSGMPYTIVRPGWFDYNSPSENSLVFLQGDKRRSGTPKDGAIARRQIARVLVQSLESPNAGRKTFELIAAEGPEQQDVEPLFQSLASDDAGAFDGVHDEPNQPIKDEPQRVRDDLKAIGALPPNSEQAD